MVAEKEVKSAIREGTSPLSLLVRLLGADTVYTHVRRRIVSSSVAPGSWTDENGRFASRQQAILHTHGVFR